MWGAHELNEIERISENLPVSEDLTVMTNADNKRECCLQARDSKNDPWVTLPFPIALLSTVDTPLPR